MSLVIDNKLVDVPGIKTISHKEDLRLEILTPEDGHHRDHEFWPVRNIVVHTSWGVPGGTGQDAVTPQKLLADLGKGTYWGLQCAEQCRKNTRVDAHGQKLRGGHHLSIDFDGVVYCHGDLRNVAFYHAHTANNWSVGIEVRQYRTGGFFAGQLEVLGTLLDFLTLALGVQRQVHLRADALLTEEPRTIFKKWRGPSARLTRTGGSNFVGVFGHRDCTNQRGFGDPGDIIMRYLFDHNGYERFDADDKIPVLGYTDLHVWEGRQLKYGADADGLPGPGTVKALRAAGFKHGMLLKRPIDDLIADVG